MGKLVNRRAYIVLISIVLCIGITIFIIRSCFGDRDVRASVSPIDIEVGESIIYSDSTRGVSTWLWEFGNGDTSPLKKGEYTFPDIGKYQVRITVDGTFEKRFVVNVRPKSTDDDDAFIKIIGPTSAMQDEYIVFRAEGPGKEWRWEFGETGIVDSREQTAIYRYEFPGTYEILLSTEETKYPIRHVISISQRYKEEGENDLATQIGNDIKQRLQNIIDQKPFNANYNYILNRYLCKDPHTMVIINNTRRNDFYSYCQGLRLIGKGRAVIDDVVVDVDPRGRSCVKKLMVVQTDND